MLLIDSTGDDMMKTVKRLSKIFITALFVLALCTAVFASTVDVVLNGAKKGSVTAREVSGRTEIAADELITLLGYQNNADAQGITARSNDKKIELWNNSDVVRVCGNMAMLASPVTFADGHWWIEKKAASDVFNQYNAVTGHSVFNFTNQSITGSVQTTQKIQAAPKIQSVEKIQAAPNSTPATKTAEVKTAWGQPVALKQKPTRRMTVKQLIAERQRRKAQSASKSESVATDSGMSDTDRFLAELEAKNKAAAKTEAAKENIAVAKTQKTQSVKTQETAEKTETAVQPVGTETAAQPNVAEAAAFAASSSVITKEFTGKRPRVVIDAGHGAHDPGAIGHSVREKDINLKAAVSLGNILKQYGAEVFYTRSTDVFLKLQERTAFANKNNADVFVSLHCNSLPKGNDSIRGIEIYLMASPRDKDSLRLAIEENKEVSGAANSVADLEKADKKTRLLLKILGDMQQTNKISESTQLIESLDKALRANKLQLRKVSQAPFFVLRGAGMPAVLIEMGYLSSASDAKKLNNAAYREQLAHSVAQGVVAYIKTHIKL